MSVGLYIHVPFCRTRCHFCAFYLQIHCEDRAAHYLDSLKREMRLHASLNSLGGRRLDTLYFGGGTPTTLQPEQLGGILEVAGACFGLQDGVEVSVEAHPETVTTEGLRRLVQTGFNRISFGVQSMNEDELIRVGRPIASKRPISPAVEAARAAGFRNINLDLIYGLPGQTIESWRTTLEAALSLEPTHLSCYALTVEGGTRLQRRLQGGDSVEPDPELENVLEDEATGRLAAAGFEHYEISNYSRPGYACRHNLLYWQGEDYLGFGPSAQSYLRGSRFGNVSDLAAYHRALSRGRLPVTETEFLPPEQRQREVVVFGLRLTSGVDLSNLTSLRNDQDWQDSLDRLTRRGLLEQRSGRLSLSDTGRRYADDVAVELL